MLAGRVFSLLEHGQRLFPVCEFVVIVRKMHLCSLYVNLGVIVILMDHRESATKKEN